MKGATAYAIMWVATSAAVIGGLIITRDANCLWALLIPSLVSYKTDK